MTISFYLFDGRDFANKFAGKIAAILTVTPRAVFQEKRRAFCGQGSVDRIGKWRWSCIKQPVLHAFYRSAIKRGGRWTGAETGATIALFNRIIVTVPVKLHPYSLALIPDRREIADSDPL